MEHQTPPPPSVSKSDSGTETLKDQEQTEQTKPDDDAVSILQSIDASKSLIAIVLGAVAYFLGWRFLFSYYAGFGLDSALFTVSPTDVIFAGWRIYFLLAGLLTLAILIWFVCRNLSQHLAQKLRLKSLVPIFYVILAAGMTLGAYVAYQFVTFYLGTSVATFRFYLTAFATIALLWIAFALGTHIHRTTRSTTSHDSAYTLFHMLFSFPFVWLVGISLVTIITLALFSSQTGTIYSARDRGEGGLLSRAAFYVDQQLDIPDGHEVRPGVWRYGNLRLVTKTDDTYFVFRPAGAVNDLYAIRKDHVIEFHTRPWFDNSQPP